MPKKTSDIDQTTLWESEFVEGITGSIKFPVSLHEVSDLLNVSEIEEVVEYKPPKKKLNEVKIVEVGKQKSKKNKNTLF
jgi:hypothetical protein